VAAFVTFNESMFQFEFSEIARASHANPVNTQFIKANGT